jgi:molybdopterin converting factor small subunit
MFLWLLFFELRRNGLMVVSVRFVGSFRGLSGKGALRVKFVRPISVEGLVRQVVEALPRLNGVLTDLVSNVPRRGMLVLVNGREISVLNGFETVVEDRDEVVFVPVVHGG